MREYGRIGLTNLRNAFSFQIIYSGGWDTSLAFVPRSFYQITYTNKMLRDMTMIISIGFVQSFRSR